MQFKSGIFAHSLTPAVRINAYTETDSRTKLLWYADLFKWSQHLYDGDMMEVISQKSERCWQPKADGNCFHLHWSFREA